MSNFWPSLPINIPASQGMPLLWDIVWWLFQLTVMVTLLILFRVFALRMDRLRDSSQKPTKTRQSSDDSITPGM